MVSILTILTYLTGRNQAKNARSLVIFNGVMQENTMLAAIRSEYLTITLRMLLTFGQYPLNCITSRWFEYI